MKDLKYIGLLCLALLTVGFTACNEDDKYFEKDAQNTPIVISKIYLEDVESSVPDREVTFARLGQIIRVEGSGLYGVKNVYVNGYATYFNRAYVSNNSMLFQLNKDTPITEAEDDVRNKIRFVKDGTETIFEFTIRAASPSITSISNTLPVAGEKVTVYGANLHETTKATLPGGIEVTDIRNDEDGEWYSFTMPSGITESGSITSEGANGTAITPAYFNENRCYVLNFDGNGGQGFWSWSETGSMCNDTDLADDPVSGSNRGKCAMLVPQRILNNDKGGVISGKSRATEWWTAGNDDPLDDWSRMFDIIPASTPVTDVAIQFDIYAPEFWSGTGYIQLCLINNYNFGGIGSDDDGDNNLVAFYVPWIQDGKVVPFSTTGWQTVTIPFSQFNKYATLIEDESTPTFQMVVDDRNAGNYKNFGIGFVNNDFAYNGIETESILFNKKVYLDNWRVVPCKKITVSDYPEDEEE
nr:glycan-binding surface protein [uncultured Bacteroides sp.]